MKPADLSKKTREELRELLAEKRTRQDELTFLLHEKKVTNVRELRVVKRDIARILTVLRAGEPSK